MSTKSLMADRRVKEVTLNDLGKAATLTLADGWTYEGQSGPFDLKNVGHGHDIVKGAINPNDHKAPRAAPRPKAKAPLSGEALGHVAGVIAEVTAPPRPAPRSGHGHNIYRTLLFCPSTNHEVAGWIKSTYAYKGDRLSEATHHQLDHNLRCAGGDPEAAEVRSYRWTKAHEKEASSAGTAGAPWRVEGEEA